MKGLDLVSLILVIIGGLNWGLVGAAQFDLVATLFGETSAMSRIVYVLVGTAALYAAVAWRAIQRRWSPAMAKA